MAGASSRASSGGAQGWVNQNAWMVGANTGGGTQGQTTTGNNGYFCNAGSSGVGSGGWEQGSARGTGRGRGRGGRARGNAFGC